MAGLLIVAALFARPSTTMPAPEPARQVAEARPRAEIEAEWRPVWRTLERLEALPREAPESGALRTELLQTAARRESAARKRGDRALAFRARVLAAELARLDGIDSRRVRDPGLRIDFLTGEAARAARVVLPGPMRTAALMRTLDEAGADELGPLGDLSRAAIEEDLAALRIDLAEALARAWIARCETHESALCCARVWRAAGRYAEAGELLARLDRPGLAPAERALLALERTRLAAARRDPETGLDALGAALTAGSRAAALELARQHLDRGESASALALARGLLEDQTQRRTARRVWAVALYPGIDGAGRLAPSEHRTP
ncbi:MAG: hypothetical protein HZA53_18585 [Planctomycetes bacterium]|nr:hypothetical protein [Planctomycetota bacterium]